MSGPLSGNQGNLYYLTTGTRASWGTTTNGVASGAAPSNLALVGEIKDVKVGYEKTKADSSVRNPTGWGSDIGTIRKAPVSFELRYDLSDAGQLALAQSFFQVGKTVACAVLDGDKATSGTFGLWADFEVMKWEKGEQLEGIQKVDVEMTPSGRSNVDPQFVTVP